MLQNPVILNFMEKVLIREYKAEDKETVEQCLFESQEDESSRRPEYWQTPEKALEDKYLDYLLKWINTDNGKLFIAEVSGSAIG